MDNPSYEHYGNHLRAFLAGLLTGSLVGAGAMLLLAPQSGKKTRAKLQQKSVELYDQTAETMEDAVAPARVKAGQITHDVSEKAEELENRGQAMFDEQSERVSTAVKAGKKAVNDLQG